MWTIPAFATSMQHWNAARCCAAVLARYGRRRLMDRKTVRIAFIYIAEAYQLYHAAAVMFELRQRDGIELDVFHIDDAVPDHLELLRSAHGRPPVHSQKLHPNLAGRAIQSVSLLGMAKPQVLAANEERFRSYDAIISTEDGITRLFEGENPNERPARILITHGAGTRFVPSVIRRSECDLILAKGEGDVRNYLATGHIRPQQIVAAGYPKLVSTSLLSRQANRLFAGARPIVLYNPHKEPKERSWDRFFPNLLQNFRDDRSRNLIVAPHVKLFRRRSERLRQKMRELSDETILVDPGSARSLDNSYTEVADTYVGDVSSQVVEFIARPRPCVFLNAHNVQWRGNPHYAMWELGEVVSSPSDVMAAIVRAPDRHHEFVERQAAFAREALGDTSENSILRSADVIEDFVARRNTT